MSTIKAIVMNHGHSTYTYEKGMRLGGHTITDIDHAWHDDLTGDGGVQHRDYQLYTGDESKPNDMQLVGVVNGAFVISVVYEVEEKEREAQDS